MALLPDKYIRKEIRELYKDERQFGRFVNALMNLENSDDWYRICGIHGATFRYGDKQVLIPTDGNIISQITGTGEVTYCPHSYFTFAAWHTQYLIEFEKLLNQYDNSIDKSVHITLPYLDLTIEDDPNSLEFLSKPSINIILNEKQITLNQNPLYSASIYKRWGWSQYKANTVRNGFIKPTNFIEKISIDNIKRIFDNSLLISTYEAFSSHIVNQKKTNNITAYEPIEQAHNLCHINIGGILGTMSNISTAAFDPIFWLHHCNIDRYFYNWLYINTNGFSKKLDSTKISQNTLSLVMAPFVPSSDQTKEYIYGWSNNLGIFMKCEESFNVSTFMYTYNKISIKSNNITLEPKYIELIDIPIPSQSTLYNVFIYPKVIKLDDKNKKEYLAGYSCWFGIDRKENNCPRCNISITNISIEVSDYIYKNKITKKNINDYNIFVEGNGLINEKKYNLDNILYDGKMHLILSWDDILDINFNLEISPNVMHTKYIQAIINKLKSFGYKIDSNIDYDRLIKLINKFQKKHGSIDKNDFSTVYTIDKLIKFKTIDLIEEETLTIKFLLNKIKNEGVETIKYNYNLNNNRIIEKINLNILTWIKTFKNININLNFELSETPDLYFEMISLDGEYSILANTIENEDMVIIRFDKDENWSNFDDKIINLIVCHEMGHAFGLNHDNDHTSIMYAFIDEEENEKYLPIEKIKELYIHKNFVKNIFL